MKCKYCNQDVENGARFCPNCGNEIPQSKQCSYCGEILDEDSLFCPNCGKEVIPSTTGDQQQSTPQRPKPTNNHQKKEQRIPWWLLTIITLGLLSLLAYGLFVHSCDGHKSKIDDEEDYKTERVDRVDSDSIQRIRLVEQQQKQDSLLNVANTLSDSLTFIKDSLKKEVDKESKEKTSKRQNDNTRKNSVGTVSRRSNSVSEVTGTKSLGYGTYKGPMQNGKPHGVNGRLIFKSTHLIDNRDPKGRIAEPGDYVIGEFFDGHLVQGVWYDAYNQVKGSIIIGR